MTVEVELPEEGIGTVLTETLRAAARGLLRVPQVFGTRSAGPRERHNR